MSLVNSELKMNKCLNILDLPDEILLIIFNKMNIVDVLYSLVDVNQRFDRLVLDPLTIRNIDMTMKTFESVYDQTFSIDDQILSRICDKILCRIYDQINALTIEQYSMKCILHATNYPQLYSLSLINFEGKILDQYLTGIVFN
jgi:hypothetical protein